MFGITEPTGSHVALLERAARVSHGLVIEHGAGLYSTPLLARLGCRVLCYESHPAWREWAAWVYQDRYRSEVTDSLDTVIAKLPDAALVFIDGSETERVRLLDAALAAGVPHIVAHDTHRRVWNYYGWRADHFTAPGYTIEHENYLDKYGTTLWTKQLGVPFDV